MIYKLMNNTAAAAVLVGMMLMMSCQEDGTTLGVGVIDETPFRTDIQEFDVFAFNKGITSVQTNKLPLYQLGNFVDPLYGRTEGRITTQVGLAGGVGNPTFGVFSQDTEDSASSDGNENTIVENERITDVFLYIPFLQNPAGDRDGDGVADEFDLDAEDPNSDSDGDGVSDNQERLNGTNPLNPDTDGDGINDDEDDDTATNVFPVTRDLDSIYGNREAPFNLKVEHSTFFLRDLDPDAGFLENQEYYSSAQFSPDFVAEVLFEGPVDISTEEILIFKEDDPDTEDVDESLEIDQRLQPGIRVALDNTFFQEKILDNEGKSQLLSQANFTNFFRGIHLSVSDDIFILLDLTDANIRINYEYDALDEGSAITRNNNYVLTVLTGGGTAPINGNAVNTLISDALPPEIGNSLDINENASSIYLKGGPGTFAEVQLFEPSNGESVINQIKENNWIINEANIVFYVDRNALDAAGITEEPPRLFLYNADTNTALYDITQGNETSLIGRIDSNYGGSLETENDKGVKYKVKITNYINDIIVRDSANATLALVVTADIGNPITIDAMLNDTNEKELPVANTMTPLSTVLVGSNVPDSDERKMKLEIFYTETQ
ncbi:MAG: DUF4270 family protein [Flavobacteriaceae bacterium]